MEEKIKNEVVKIISDRRLKSMYQPIVSLKDGTVYAYEALSRITYEEATISIAELFSNADKLGYLWELEKICRTNALKNAVDKPKNTKLFINIDGNVLRDSKFHKGFTKEKLEKYSLSTSDVVFELTERSDFEDHKLLHDIIMHYVGQGYEVAIDDLGSGYSGLNRLQNIQPGYVKIDYELVHDVHKDKSKRSIIRMLVGHCEEMDYKLIAEGIESEDELKCLINLGVEFGQGFFIGKPRETFDKVNKSVKKTICFLQKDKKSNKNKIGNISRMGTVLYPACSIGHAMELFSNNKKLNYISVVDNKFNFYGIVKRTAVMNYPVNPESITHKIEELMETDVTQIDAEQSMKNGIGIIMTKEDDRFYDPFIILKKGKYYGIATVRDMVVEIGKKL